jgi:hypothetical protein
VTKIICPPLKNNTKPFCTSLKTLSKISPNEIQIIFEYLLENEIQNLIKFFQKHILFGKNKINNIPQTQRCTRWQ